MASAINADADVNVGELVKADYEEGFVDLLTIKVGQSMVQRGEAQHVLYDTGKGTDVP